MCRCYRRMPIQILCTLIGSVYTQKRLNKRAICSTYQVKFRVFYATSVCSVTYGEIDRYKIEPNPEIEVRANNEPKRNVKRNVQPLNRLVRFYLGATCTTWLRIFCAFQTNSNIYENNRHRECIVSGFQFREISSGNVIENIELTVIPVNRVKSRARTSDRVSNVY